MKLQPNWSGLNCNSRKRWWRCRRTYEEWRTSHLHFTSSVKDSWNPLFYRSGKSTCENLQNLIWLQFWTDMRSWDSLVRRDAWIVQCGRWTAEMSQSEDEILEKADFGDLRCSTQSLLDLSFNGWGTLGNEWLKYSWYFFSFYQCKGRPMANSSASTVGLITDVLHQVVDGIYPE